MKLTALPKPGSMVRVMARALSPEPTEAARRTPGERLLGVSNPGDMQDGWARRVVELGDGRHVTDVVDALYSEELAAGAWMADIGVWRGLFIRVVTELIHDLARQGHVVISIDGEPQSKTSPPWRLEAGRKV